MVDQNYKPNAKHEPIFKRIFGTSWQQLPAVLKQHYVNRPYTNDTVIAAGRLDIFCTGYIRQLAPLFWLLGTIPPITEKNVPVIVHFDSDPKTDHFYFNRTFYFKNRKPYHFRSRMIHIKDSEILEIMRFGLCWRMNCLWEDGKVKLKHKGYALNIFGLTVPLPITFLIGRGDGQEWAVDENTFDMCVTITHSLFGKSYEYKGRFKIKPAT